jgi:predicted acylesterase/phospholipase RssA
MYLSVYRNGLVCLSLALAMVIAGCAHVSKYELGRLEPPDAKLSPEEELEFRTELEAQHEEELRKPEWEWGATPTEETPVVRDPFSQEGMVTFSGGGYRSLLFGLGAAWRLHELGTLCRMRNISSVSGGSPLAAYIGLHWKELCPPGRHTGDFREIISKEIIGLTRHTIDVPAVSYGLFIPWDSASFEVSKRLDRYLFHGARLRDLLGPRNPGIHIFATDLGTGMPWEFSGDQMGLTQLYPYLPSGEIRIADAVAASAAFPPVLSPARFSFQGADRYVEKQLLAPIPTGGVDNTDLNRRLARHYNRVLLGDGGLANNLGTALCDSLEASGPCFVIDAAVTPQRARVYPTWFGQLLRSTSILYDRKEDEIRINTHSQPKPFFVESVLIKLRNRGDMQGHRVAAGVLADLKNQLPELLKLARGGDPYLLKWAEQADQLWNAGYFEGDVLTLVENYQQYACNSMIATRLKSLDDRTIHDLVNLGYIAADLAVGAEVALSSFGRSNESLGYLELESLVKRSIPGLLRTKLQLPMPLEAIPSKSCREALE